MGHRSNVACRMVLSGLQGDHIFELFIIVTVEENTKLDGAGDHNQVLIGPP